MATTLKDLILDEQAKLATKAQTAATLAAANAAKQAAVDADVAAGADLTTADAAVSAAAVDGVPYDAGNGQVVIKFDGSVKFLTLTDPTSVVVVPDPVVVDPNAPPVA